MATPRFAWGIDVGNRALKAVKLVREADGLRVDDVDVIEHEHILSDAGDNKETLIANALSMFAQKHPEKGGAVAVGVSGQSSFARFIKLPPVEEKKVPEIVRFEAIQQIPFPLDDVEWSYQLFQDEGSPEKEVGIFAMRKELVNQHIKNFTDAGLNVQAVQMNPLAVYNAMYHDDRIKGATMIVDVGAENTDLIIAEGEQIWLRSIPVGGNNFTEALIKQFKLKFPKAEELKRNAATSKYTRQILQAMRPVFDSLVAEIQRSIGFYASVHRDSKIARVIALGGTFRLPGLLKFLQMQLQLDVQRLDALAAAPPADARVGTLLNENLLSLVAPYGLALQVMGQAKINSSLLPMAIQRERMWREKTKWFAAAAALVLGGTGVAFGRYTYEQMRYASGADTRNDIQRQVTPAKSFSSQWQEIEQAGEPERKIITSMQSTTKGRGLWGEITLALERATPEPQPKPEGKRPDRNVVLVENFTTKYVDDIAPVLALSLAEFNGKAEGTRAGGAAGRGMMANMQMGGPPGGGGGRALAGAAMAGMMGGGPSGGAEEAPSEPAPGEGEAASDKQRGFLITLNVRTPRAPWREIIEPIRKALLEQTKSDGKTPQRFKIERVEFVSGVPIEARENGKQDTPRRGVRGAAKNPRNNNTPARRGGFGGGMGGMAGGGMGGMAGAGMGGMAGGGMRPPMIPGGGGDLASGAMGGMAGGGMAGPRPGAAGGAGRRNQNQPAEGDEGAEEAVVYEMPSLNFESELDPAEEAKLERTDPVTGEDARGDHRLTFLVAVVLDPTLPKPAEGGEGAAPAAATEDGEAAPEGAAPAEDGAPAEGGPPPTATDEGEDAAPEGAGGPPAAEEQAAPAEAEDGGGAPPAAAAPADAEPAAAQQQPAPPADDAEPDAQAPAAEGE
jgi:type IV pilus assembly protein PilM